MPWLTADQEFKVQLSATEVASPTYPITISGADNGWEGIMPDVRAQYIDQKGFYPGLPQSFWNKRYEPVEIEQNLYANDNTKFLIGKAGQRLYTQLKTYAEDGTTLKVTEKYDFHVVRADLIPESSGDAQQIALVLKLFDFEVTVA